MRTIYQRENEALPAEIQVWRPRAAELVRTGESVSILDAAGNPIGWGKVIRVGADSYTVRVNPKARG